MHGKQIVLIYYYVDPQLLVVLVFILKGFKSKPKTYKK